MKNLLFLNLIMVMLATSACGEEPERITPSMKTQIDTTYRKMTKALKIEMDSICDQKFDKQVKIAKDSIMIERLAERKKKLGY